MPISQGNVFASAFPGLTLRAWVHVVYDAGGPTWTIASKSANVSTVTYNNRANFNVNFGTALPTASFLMDAAGPFASAVTNGQSTTYAQVILYDESGGATTTAAAVYLGFYS